MQKQPGSPHIISFGETMLRLSPPAGTRIEQASHYNVYVAGSESNLLAVAARLGMRATWLSVLPSNAQGRRVDGELRLHGIDTSRVVWAGAEERLGIFYAEESAPPMGAQVIYDRAGSAFARLDPSAINTGDLESGGILHLSGITPALGERAGAVFSSLLRAARGTAMPLSFDVNYRARLWSAAEAAQGIEEACKQAELLFCTQEDAAAMWGFNGTPEQVLSNMAGRFGMEGKTLVLTVGGEGSAQLARGEHSFEKAFPSAGPYRFGSGDAFAGGYLFAHLGGQGYGALAAKGVTPLAFGNACAALKRCIEGDIATLTYVDVESLILGATRFR